MVSVQTESTPTAINQQPPIKPVIQFPHEGKVRAKQIAEFMAIGISTWWLYVSQQRVKQPQRYGKRVSVWDAAYIRELAEHGIPDAPEQEAA